jgi:threonine/homoserine/homoserine lactone efflux protein
MSLSVYGAFLGFAIVLVLIPGPDFAVVTKNTLAGGRRRGWFTAAGVGTSNAVQGAVAVSGLSAIILRAQPVFTAIKWAGVCYLAVLGIQSLASAIRGTYDVPGGEQGTSGAGAPLGGWRQGFLSNITNPKVLIFYIAVLPQFLKPGAAPGWLLAFAWSHAALSVVYLMALSTGLAKARSLLASRRVRRTMDMATGAVLLGFSARLAAEHG